MKIVIFEPHPDDLLFGPGPKIFDWITDGHDIHVVTVTDGRAGYRGVRGIKMSEDDVAEMRINEAKKVIEFLGINQENHHILYFHDAEGRKYVKDGIERVKPIISDAERIVLPSNHNSHRDHQATHNIAIRAAIDLNLDIEYFVYFIPAYGQFNEDSKDKQIFFEISEDLREKLLEWLQIYQSQKKIKVAWKLYTGFLKTIRKITYSVFQLEDKGKYYNF